MTTRAMFLLGFCAIAVPNGSCGGAEIRWPPCACSDLPWRYEIGNAEQVGMEYGTARMDAHHLTFDFVRSGTRFFVSYGMPAVDGVDLETCPDDE